LRLAALLIALLALLGAFYLHQVGVPRWAREQVSAALRRHGVELGFQRLRLHWYHGLVADEVTLALPRSPGSPRVAFAQVVVNLDWRALWADRTFEVRTLTLRNGRAVLPLAETNAPPEDLVVDDIAAQLELAEPALWRIAAFSARCLGATLQAHGTLTNGFALWRAPARTPSAAPAPAAGDWRDRLRAAHRLLTGLRFASPPELRLRFAGDARRADAWSADLQARVPGVDTPWGRGRELQVLAHWKASARGDAPGLELDAALAEWSSRPGRARDVRLRLQAPPPRADGTAPPLTWEVRAAGLESGEVRALEPRLSGQTRWTPSAPGGHTTVDLSATGLRSPWAGAERLTARLELEHPPAGGAEAWTPHVRSAHVQLGALGRGEVQLAELDLDLDVQPARSRPADTTLSALPAVWRALAPFEVRLGLRASGLTTPGLVVDHLSLDGQWGFPEWTLTHLQARLLDGTLRLSRGRLEVVSRETAVEWALDFDVQKLGTLLSDGMRRWLAQFQYAQPPQAAGFARVRLPPWDAWGPDAARQLLPGLELRARLDGRDVSYRGLPCAVAGVTITVSNQVLRLRDLELVRPEGRAALAYDLDLRTRDFRWRVDCALDARAAAPVVDDALPPIVALFEFPTPPRVTGEVWGNWNPPKPVDFALHVSATNFTFRGEAFETLSAGLGKTHRVLRFTDARLTRGAEWLEAPWVEYDLDRRVVTLTNAQTQMDPLVVARCIGPEIAAALEPYHFDQPPRVTVSGTVPVGQERHAAALDLEVAGGPFRFWRFHTTNLTAGVRWRGETVSVTNVAASFYGGRLSGGIDLNLQPGGGAIYAFQAQATEFDLRALLRDVLPESTNRIEGITTLSLIVTDAQTADWKSWHGRGRVEMRDGLLWDLPIFGFLSRALNVVVPGLGNSRATAARASFRIQRSVIFTDDLAIEAGPARLQYRGTVDFDGRVDARVVAEVLHRTPIIGPLISLALAPVAKVFEYKVTGTLGQPELKPLHVPGILRPLLNPLGTLQNLVTPPAAPPPTPEPAP
jgi:hypothetical protein